MLGQKTRITQHQTWRSMPGTPNFMPFLGSWYEQLSDKTFIFNIVLRTAFPLQTSSKKSLPCSTDSMFILVFSTKHKWVNINVYTKYWLQQNTKHFLYLSETEYTQQVFFQNIFIGKGLKTILIIHIWSQFCLKKIVGKCT